MLSVRSRQDYDTSHPLVPVTEVRSWLAGLATPVAITGGTGFVGSHLVDCLVGAGLRPRVLVRDPTAPRWIANAAVDWVTGSLADPEALATLVQGAGTVVHLAGVVRAPRAADFDRGNRQGTANLVAAARAAAPAARLVYVSSLAAAGPSATPEGIGPEAPPRPISAYGRSKLAAEAEVRALADQGRWTVLRPPAIYGPRDSDIYAFFRMINLGLVAMPCGRPWITLAFVGDVVRAILAAAAATGSGGCYHLGEPRPCPFAEVLHQLADAGQVSARVIKVPRTLIAAAGLGGSALQLLGLRRLPVTMDKAREILARHWTARTADSLAALGLEQTIPLADGAALTWRWYRAQGWLA